ncbi:protamine-like [Coccinella septempunctata]|uniref:protamine-like n=1 Tax=Coccinella septempunctata TaxID=41139 RepID=UPI001D08B748|nr:protamine-like [Coccinella septempunctata]
MSQNSCTKSDTSSLGSFIPSKTCVKKKKKRRRKGKITKNPFFNFLRMFRSRHSDWTVPKIAVEGAKCWCAMTEAEKKRFYKQAHRAFLRSMRRASGGRNNRGRRCSSVGKKRRTRRANSCPNRRRSKHIAVKKSNSSC